MKTCTKCLKTKKEFEFSKNNNARDGLQNWCKSCLSQYNKEFKLANREFSKRAHHKSRYNLTPAEFDTLSKVCQICGTEKDLCIDHNHIFGFVRGILCGHCNRGLGNFKEDIDLLKKAMRYLEEN